MGKPVGLRFGQMVGKFPYWEIPSGTGAYHLPAEIPTNYEKKCTMATANEGFTKQELKQRLCTGVIFGIFLCRSVHKYNVK